MHSGVKGRVGMQLYVITFRLLLPSCRRMQSIAVVASGEGTGQPQLEMIFKHRLTGASI